MRKRGKVTLILDPDEAEFLADCVSMYDSKDQAANELYRLAEKARKELDDDY